MRKVRKCVEVILELDNTENIQIGFPSIIERIDKGFSNGIKETNIKMKNSCINKGAGKISIFLGTFCIEGGGGGIISILGEGG